VGRSARLVNLLRVQHAQQEEKESYKEQSAYDPIKKLPRRVRADLLSAFSFRSTTSEPDAEIQSTIQQSPTEVARIAGS
jgi:hypothetical protein